MRKLEYFKTDRNGTKYYYDYNCPRCGGAGASDNWYRTGRTCYECGGSGLRHNPKIIKEYTPEYEAKLTERRQARMAAKNKVDEAEQERRNKQAQLSIWKLNGFNENGEAFIYYGDTYHQRNIFKNAGGQFVYWLKCWVVPVEVETECQMLKITADDWFKKNEYGQIQLDDKKQIAIGKKIGTY